MGLLTKLFGTRSEREVKSLTATVDKIEALEPEYQALTDQQLRAKTDEFKARLANGETLDDILPEALPPAARQRCVCWACVTTGCSSLAVSFCTRAALPK